MTRRKVRSAERGFTLIEMLVSAAIMLFMLAAVTQLALAQSYAATESVMDTESARYAQSLVQEQVALGYTYVALNKGNTLNSTYVPLQGSQGYNISATLQFVDASGPVSSGSVNIGAPSVLLIATTSWSSPLKGTKSYVQQIYVTAPPTVPSIP